jgi:hypothetical protein
MLRILKLNIIKSFINHKMGHKIYIGKVVTVLN